MTNPLLLIALGLLIGGFAAINKFAPEPMQVGEHVVTQKSLYTASVPFNSSTRVRAPQG